MLELALLGSGLLGFAVGLFSFKVKARWCPEHGLTLTCPQCTAR
jgi:hypothetical protein